ncbi:hypothetical protein HY989_01410 [Candidatus Micrarchaeota archaeon]|nr:hypothetical protein [Candidatus Micrarchaeota archaeon]
MELEEIQNIYSELEKILRERCKNHEFYFLFAIENSGIGEGKATGTEITSLNQKKALGSWKCIKKTVDELVSLFEDEYSGFGENKKYDPVQPKQ